MQQRMVTTWDGLEFAQKSNDEAELLEKEDKCQILDNGFIDGLSLKYRSQFKGYMTREMRATPPPAPVEVVSDPPAEAASWEDYKAAYKEATGKKRASRAPVEAWMREEGIL